jgi:hypothetical protein
VGWEILSVLAPVVCVSLLGLIVLYALSRAPRRPRWQNSTGPLNRLCRPRPQFDEIKVFEISSNDEAKHTIAP